MNALLLRVVQTQIALILGCGVLLIFGMYRLQTSRSLAERSDADWLATEQLAKDLEKLRNELPATGAAPNQSESAITQLKLSLEQAQVAESKLGDVRVLGRTDVPKSRFAREDTSVGLKQVTMPAAISIIQSQEDRPGTLCSGISIQTVTGRTDDLELWDVGLTLTSLVAQPRENRSSSN